MFLTTSVRGVNGEQLAIFNEMEVHFKATSAETKQHIFNMSQTFKAIFEETTFIRFTECWDIFPDVFVAATPGSFNEASVHFSSVCLATNCIIFKKTTEDLKAVLVTTTPSIFNRMLVHFPAVLMKC